MKRRWILSVVLLVAVTFVSLLGISYYLDLRLKNNYHKILFGNTYGIYSAIVGQFQWASHDFHPTRGWTPKRNLDAADGGLVWTNDRGYRSRDPYVYQPDKFTVLVVGDSFTFGDEVSNNDAWPQIMADLDSRLHVINLGVSGYGIDQMLITEQETISGYRPQLVVFAFVSPDLDRAMWSYFAAAKPRFVLNPSGQLALQNVPLDDPETTAARLKSQYAFPFGAIKLHLEEISEEVREMLPSYAKSRDRLASRIVEEAEACAKTNASDFLLVQLHCTQGEGLDDGLEFLAEFEKRHPKTHCLQTKNAFKGSGKVWPNGHYRREGAELAAKTVLETIYTLDSWKAYEGRSGERSR